VPVRIEVEPARRAVRKQRACVVSRRAAVQLGEQSLRRVVVDSDVAGRLEQLLPVDLHAPTRTTRHAPGRIRTSDPRLRRPPLFR
jgi:hypothetical protein